MQLAKKNHRDFDSHMKALAKALEKKTGSLMPVVIGPDMDVVNGIGRLQVAAEAGKIVHVSCFWRSFVARLNSTFNAFLLFKSSWSTYWTGILSKPMIGRLQVAAEAGKKFIQCVEVTEAQREFASAMLNLLSMDFSRTRTDRMPHSQARCPEVRRTCCLCPCCRGAS
mgnify:CR=1 FL=1